MTHSGDCNSFITCTHVQHAICVKCALFEMKSGLNNAVRPISPKCTRH